MTSSTLRIICIGTPDFSVPSFEAILAAGYNIVAVITAPDRPTGRGLKLKGSPVKEFAERNGIEVLQPTNLKNPEFLSHLKSLNADIQIVIAFRMLPEAVWNMPPMGTINLHASLLPNYRGAAPINWVIINGEKTTGLTTFKLKHQIDTGDLLLQKIIEIGPDETVGQLHDRLMLEGADLMVQTLKGVESGTLIPKSQEVLTSHVNAPKIFKEDCEINWHKNGEDIINLIRGMSPYPAARCQFQNKVLKVYTAEFVAEKHDTEIGKIHSDQKTYLSFSCKNGSIYLKDLQLEGKKRMPVDDFLRGVSF